MNQEIVVLAFKWWLVGNFVGPTLLNTTLLNTTLLTTTLLNPTQYNPTLYNSKREKTFCWLVEMNIQ